MSDSSMPGKDTLQLVWIGDDGTASAEFRDPLNGTPSIRLCFYDSSGRSQPLLNAYVAPAGTCGLNKPKPCWKQTGGAHPTGFKYGDPSGTPDGIINMTLKSAAAGKKAKVIVKGKGDMLALPVPLDDLQLPVTAQLVIGDGETGQSCWQATFSAAKTQTAARLVVKGP